MLILINNPIPISCLKTHLTAPHINVFGLQEDFKMSDGKKARGGLRRMNLTCLRYFGVRKFEMVFMSHINSAAE